MGRRPDTTTDAAKLRQRFPLTLDDATYEALRQRAFRERRHMTDVVRSFVIEGLRRPPTRRS